MLMAALEAAARALGGDIYHGQILCPGPGHSPKDRSLAVRLDHRAPDGFVVHSYAGDDFALCRDHVRALLGIRRDQSNVQAIHRMRPEPVRFEDAGRTEQALAIWRQAQHPAGTPVEVYLANRGLTLPTEAAGQAIRFHPACPFRGRRVPAMVALVHDVRMDAPKAIHRTAITLDGRKAEVDGASRLSLGPVGGGAVKITPDADVTQCLGVGEGIETTLSLRRLPEFVASPVWPLLSAGQVAALPVLPGVECLWIAVDHDENGHGQCAAGTVADRWHRAGVEVRLLRPVKSGSDMNDVVREAA
ncbi:MAG: toprim domain-containing protein [Rhodoplanes sp.]|uniref:DUF7146 domain-containing protein n=1 Tax=Rhodoplanes sp. TaxID=1968906 RepID=UPI0017D9E0BF|nr:toprim domain-containing protein [Rhodoplanes sp.]NVO13524.1 toprim domain-containing protein [Rhodoplanes sp.]